MTWFKSIWAWVAGAAVIAALWFRGELAQTRAKEAEEDAARSKAAIEGVTDAQRDLRETQERQAEERERPDVEERDGFEEGW